MQPMWLWLFSCRQFVDTFENAYWRKLKQMQPMQLWLLSGRRFEDTFENTQHLRIHWSVWDFTGASVNLLERLRASVGFRNFDGASEIFRSVCEMYGTKKILHEKTLPSVCTNRIGVSQASAVCFQHNNFPACYTIAPKNCNLCFHVSLLFTTVQLFHIWTLIGGAF